MFVPLKTRFRIITRTYFAASRIVSRDKSIEQNIQEWSTRRKKSSLHGMRIKPMILHHNYIYRGGISKQGATQLVIFDGIMNATRYGDILKASLVPFIRKNYPESHRLYQDNDPKHTSRYIQRFFDMNKVNWWKSPAESPDLNPIEKVWGSMKTYLRDKHKPKNLEQLKEGIQTYWKKLTPEVCTRYIDHLQKVMPVVIQEQGAPSGH